MFNGEQIQQFIAAAAAAAAASSPPSIPFPLPLSLPLHVTPSIFSGFSSGCVDTSPPPPPPVLQSHLLHGLPVELNTSQEENQEEDESSRSIDLERDRPISDPKNRWVDDEPLQLTRVGSTMEGGFPASIIPRMGFNRAAQSYPERAESVEEYQSREEEVGGRERGRKMVSLNLEEYSGDEAQDEQFRGSESVLKVTAARKRKRGQSLKMMKGVCEEIVEKLMAEQEQLQRRLLEDMERREGERVAREEAAKMQEIAKLDREIEMREQEQALNCSRDATIINLLKKFTSDQTQNKHQSAIGDDNSNPKPIPPSSPVPPPPQSPNLPSVSRKNLNPASSAPNSASSGPDVGRRWPKAEVYSLINLRCSLSKNPEEKNSAASRVSLWERISQGMKEMGYSRSAKRCKEKWENINKYFKKTRDGTRRRAPNAKTCPYFDVLRSLYGQAAAPLAGDPAEAGDLSPVNNDAAAHVGGEESNGDDD